MTRLVDVAPPGTSLYVPPPAGTGIKEMRNSSFYWTFIGTGFWFLLMWFTLAAILAARFGVSSLEAVSSFSTLLLVAVGISWVLILLFAAYVLGLANSPPVITVGRDFVSGTPPLRIREFGEARNLTIPFAAIRRVGWSLAGPAVITNKQGPPGPGLLLSFKVARIVKERWVEWKADQRQV